jgi:hypothetical protein
MDVVGASLLDRVELVGKVLVGGEERCCSAALHHPPTSASRVRSLHRLQPIVVASSRSSRPPIIVVPGVCARSVLPLRPRTRTIDHIVISCSLAKQVWWNISNILNQVQGMATYDTILEFHNAWRSQWNGPYRRSVNSVFALVAWEQWKERNAGCL